MAVINKFQVSKPTKLTDTILSLSSIPRYGTQKSCYSRILTTRFLSDFRFVSQYFQWPNLYAFNLWVYIGLS